MNDQRFFNIGLPQLPLNTDPKIEPDLRDLYNAVRNLTYLLGQYGGFETPEAAYQNIAGVEYAAGYYKRRVYVEATEIMVYGAAVNLYNVAGILKARAANATGPAGNIKPCYGIKNTTGSNGIGDTIEVVLPGCYVNSIGGLVPGTRYFLDKVAGQLNAGPAFVAGDGRQVVGFALTATVFFFFPNIDWTVV